MVSHGDRQTDSRCLMMLEVGGVRKKRKQKKVDLDGGEGHTWNPKHSLS